MGCGSHCTLDLCLEQGLLSLSGVSSDVVYWKYLREAQGLRKPLDVASGLIDATNSFKLRLSIAFSTMRTLTALFAE